MILLVPLMQYPLLIRLSLDTHIRLSSRNGMHTAQKPASCLSDIIFLECLLSTRLAHPWSESRLKEELRNPTSSFFLSSIQLNRSQHATHTTFSEWSSHIITSCTSSSAVYQAGPVTTKSSSATSTCSFNIFSRLWALHSIIQAFYTLLFILSITALLVEPLCCPSATLDQPYIAASPLRHIR